MLNLVLQTAPKQEPLKVQEVKDHLRITWDDEDPYLSSVILPAARNSVEIALNRALITQTWDWYWDGGFPATGMITLPKPPLQSITSVNYTDADGAAQTWASSNYNVSIKGQFGRLWLANGVTWPIDLQDNTPGVAYVRFVAGYGDDGDAVPEGIRHLILLMCGEMYRHREITLMGTTIMEIPMQYRALVMQHRALHPEHFAT